MWKDIPGYEGRYQINILGQIRKILKSGETRPVAQWRKPATKTARRRLYAKLGGKEYAVMRLMVMTFHGKPPEGKVAYHKDGCVANNHIENIGFITREELGHKTGGRTNKARCVLKINEAGECIEIFRSARECGKNECMSYQAVLDRCNGKVKKEYALTGYTYRWED